MKNTTKAIPSPDMIRLPLTAVIATTWSDANLLTCPACGDLTVHVVDVGRIVDGDESHVLVTLACGGDHQFFIQLESSHGITMVRAGGSVKGATS